MLRSPLPTSDAEKCFVDASLHLDNLLEVVGLKRTCVDLHGNLIEVVADSLQFRDQWAGIFRNMDLGELGRCHDVVGDAHPGFRRLLGDGILFACRHPDGEGLVSFSIF